MIEDQSTIFSKLLKKDKEIEGLRDQMKILIDEKSSLEYMLIKSSEQIRKLQEQNEQQQQSRNQCSKQQDKLNTEIDLLKKEVQMAQLNCQSYEKQMNIKCIEMEGMFQYNMKLSKTVSNAYNIINHYKMIEKEKQEIENKYKKQKKNYKCSEKEIKDLMQILIDQDPSLKNEDNLISNAQKYLSKVKQQIKDKNKEYLVLQDQHAEKEKEIKKIYEQNQIQKQNINELNKQISFLKIENLSQKNKLQQKMEEAINLDTYKQNLIIQQNTLKKILCQTNQLNNTRTKSLDNSFHNKFKTDGDEQILTQNQVNQCCLNCSLNQRMNVFQKEPQINILQSSPNLPIKNQRGNSYDQQDENINQTATLQTKHQRNKSDTYCKQQISSPELFLNYKSNHNFSQDERSQIKSNQSKQLDNSTNDNTMIVDEKENQNKKKLQKHFNNKSYNNIQSILSQNYLSEKDRLIFVQCQNICCRNNQPQSQNQLETYKNNSNESSSIKSILLNIEDIILQQKVNQQFLNQENIISEEQEISQENQLLLNNMDIIIQSIAKVQVWEYMNVILLAQKMKNLIQIVVTNVNMTDKLHNLEQEKINSNSSQSNTGKQNTPQVTYQQIFNGVSQIIEKVGDFEEHLTAEQQQRNFMLGLSTNHISIIKELDEPQQQNNIKYETMPVERLNKDKKQNQNSNKTQDQNDIKKLLTQLQELKKSEDYLQNNQSGENKKINQKQIIQSIQNNEYRSLQQNENQNISNYQNTHLKQSQIQQQKVKTNDKCIQTVQISYINQNDKQQNTNFSHQIQKDASLESSINIDKLKKQMQSQFTKKVKDLEQVLIILQELLNDEQENSSNNANISYRSQQQNALNPEQLQKLYSNNPNLKPFLQNFIQKISNLKMNNEYLKIELQKYTLSNKHIKSMR